MRVLQRVEEIRREEHVRLRMAIERASRAIDDLQSAQVEAVREAPKDVDMFGDPIANRRAEMAADPVQRINLMPLLSAWQPFEAMLIARVDTWEMDLWPLVRRWSMGEPVAGAVRAVASNMIARRSKLEPRLREVRIQTSFVGSLRPPLVAVFSAVEACDAVEAEVVPLLVAGRTDLPDPTIEGAPPITLSPDEVTRNLRSQTRGVGASAAATAPQSSNKAKDNLLERMMKLFKLN